MIIIKENKFKPRIISEGRLCTGVELGIPLALFVCIITDDFSWTDLYGVMGDPVTASEYYQLHNTFTKRLIDSESFYFQLYNKYPYTANLTVCNVK